jgi:hypothetical protein
MNSENNSQAVAVRDGNFSLMASAGSLQELSTQIRHVQLVMREHMKPNFHYGVTPGCKAPSLYKAGAEKLAFVFRLAPEFDVKTIDLPDGHQEVRVICTITHIPTGMKLGQGVGSCTSMEAKYRFRTGPKEFTGRPAPQGYFDIRKSDYKKAQELIGGPGHSVAKNDQGQWEIVRQGDKMEHDNPADYGNTVLKMSKKRAFVDAVLTVTAASDIFTQDLEDDDERHDDGGTVPRDNKQANGNGNRHQTHTNQNDGPPNDPPTENTGNWREVVLHFGKNKDHKLGDLQEKSLQWYCESWTPTPHPTTGMLNANDLFLRKALDAAAKELGFSTPPPAK